MRRSVAAVLAAVLLAAAGCGSSGPAQSGATAAGDRVTVLAAASLTEAFRAIDPGAALSFGGSDQLAFQVEQGAPADVFASASPTYADALRAKGLVGAPRVFATNRVVVIVPRANPAGIRSVRDLARPGVKLVVGDPGVPIGAYTEKALEALGLRAALGNVVSRETDVKAVVAKVALGEADAGMAYATDVRPAAGRVRALPVPAAAQPVARYEIAVVRDAPHRAAAEAFVRRVLGPQGRAELARRGFGLPAP
jgi:molybdate transport system substrate-binding protein